TPGTREPVRRATARLEIYAELVTARFSGGLRPGRYTHGTRRIRQDGQEPLRAHGATACFQRMRPGDLRPGAWSMGPSFSLSLFIERALNLFLRPEIKGQIADIAPHGFRGGPRIQSALAQIPK